VASGSAVVPGATLIGIPSTAAIAQHHYMLAWPSGTHDHSADISIGFYSPPGSKCAVLMSGVVH
jgi:hypothetical protein